MIKFDNLTYKGNQYMPIYIPAEEKHKDNLKRIKSNVEEAHKYFKPNYVRFNEYKNLVCNTSLSEDEVSLLQQLKKPQIEVNILEAYISRLIGEFLKNEPSIVVSAKDGQAADPELLEFYEGHIRYILWEANNNSINRMVYFDTLTGGFSAFKVWTEYENDMSFNQVIKVGKVPDPCITGFDPLALLPHKADGRYCFECFPKTKDEFKKEYPNVDLEAMNFKRDIGGDFSWSYNSNKQDILLLCDYYEKKKYKKKIVLLSDNQVMTADEYKKFKQEWESTGRIEQIPQIVDERKTEIEKIVRYRFIENEILEHVETDFSYFPIIFVDGNSVMLRQQGNNLNQMTRPYVYHAKGIQKLKNFSVQTLANELENMTQSKLIIAKEAIAIGYEDAYFNPQTASVYVYNHFNNNNPDQVVPAPIPMPRVPAPPEVMGTVTLTDQALQGVLGAYDPQIGNLNGSELSGKAIIESASLGNSCAMPYVASFLQGQNQKAQVICDLIPKYGATPRTLPIIDKEGNRKVVKINQEDGISLDYNKNPVSVKVEAGPSFGVQKTRAYQQIIALMQASPIISEFISTEGAMILLDNVEMRGIDQLKDKFKVWYEKKQQEQQQMMQAQQEAQQNQITPEMMQMQIAQQQLALEEMRMKISEQDLYIKNKKIDVEADLKAQQITTERLKVLGQLEQEAMKNDIELRKTDIEEFTKSVDMALKTEKEIHAQTKEHDKINILE